MRAAMSIVVTAACLVACAASEPSGEEPSSDYRSQFRDTRLGVACADYFEAFDAYETPPDEALGGPSDRAFADELAAIAAGPGKGTPLEPRLTQTAADLRAGAQDVGDVPWDICESELLPDQ